MDNIKINVNFSFLNILLLINIILKLVKIINYNNIFNTLDYR